MLKALRAGLSCFPDVEIADFGEATTPELHYYVRSHNDASFGAPTRQGYYRKIADSFNQLMHKHASGPRKIVIDCANGIGATAAKEFAKYVDEEKLVIEVVNDKIRDPDLLNKDVSWNATLRCYLMGGGNNGLFRLERIM